MRSGLLSSWRYLDQLRSTSGTFCLSDYGSLRLRREPFSGSALPQDRGDFSEFRMWVRVCTGFGFGFGVFLRAEAGISPRQATYFLACQKVGKEHRPYCPRPSGFACGQPAPSSSWGCAAQLTACLRHSVQTNGRKSEHEAAALCGAAASPKNLPSQAWAQGAIPGAG